ncbi:hypothetical protein ACFFNY_07015 [Paenibacillus hodogayensis]|uniref:Translation initiation factor 2 n=1 Tax=Paenibacillus hodogayensis TaxID=279208 RepID=A0ABV5VSW0_9BACL
MNRHSVTFIVIVLMLCFGVFFGIELATRGMERIQGPVGGYPAQGGTGAIQPSAPASGGVQPGAAGGTGGANGQPYRSGVQAGADKGMGGTASAGKGDAPVAAQPQPPKPQPLAVDSGMNRVGNQIGDMLQTAAHGTIRAIVSLLDSIVN